MRCILVLLLIALALSVASWAGADAVPAPPTVQDVGEGLTCQCGCGLTVANCNHPSCGFAVPTRGEIGAMIKRGMSRAQILLAYRHKYGEKVLSAPTTEGFNLLAWIIPYVAVGAGMVLILVAVVRWRRPEMAEPGVGKPGAIPGATQFDAGLRQRLEQDLRRQL